MRNQRETIGRLESFGQYAPRNFGAELLDVAASYENGLARGYGPARR